MASRRLYLMPLPGDDGAGAGSVIGDVAIGAYKRPDVGGNCAVAASACDSVGVRRVATRIKVGCCHTCHQFGGVSVGCGSTSSLGGMS